MSGEDLRARLLAAIRGGWSTRPTCWDRQVNAVTAVLSEQTIDHWGLAERDGSEDMRVRCTCGETACESDLCDCDAVPCPVNHRAEEAEAEAKRLQGELIAARECIASLEGILDELTISANEAAIAWGADVDERDALKAANEQGRVVAQRWLDDLKPNERESWAVPGRHVCGLILAALDASEARSVLDRVSDWAADRIARGES